MIRGMDRSKPQMPVLATVCCFLFGLAALIAVLIRPHTTLPFYFGFGFFLVVIGVWFRGRVRRNA
jgi:hypothetical protein